MGGVRARQRAEKSLSETPRLHHPLPAAPRAADLPLTGRGENATTTHPQLDVAATGTRRLFHLDGGCSRTRPRMFFVLSKLFCGSWRPAICWCCCLSWACALRLRRRRGLGAGRPGSSALRPCVLPVGGWLAAPLEERFPGAEPAGADRRHRPARRRGQRGPPRRMARSRSTTWRTASSKPALARRYPDAKVLAQRRRRHIIPEASRKRMRRAPCWSRSASPAERILIDDRSRNTYRECGLFPRMASSRSRARSGSS